MDDPLPSIAATLRDFDGPGSFAARHTEAAQGLGIDVDGVGVCRFPLSQPTVAALIAHAAPSPFGYRDVTLRDPAVRDSWELPAARVHLDDRWRVRLDRSVAALAQALGLPDDAPVTPTLQKLLVYETGQFFARHRDTEKEPGTVATLVIVLPCAHEGGEVVVTHGSDALVFATADDARANRLSFLAFYADCVHETRPVTEGHRVALAFSLALGGRGARAPMPVSERLEALRAGVAVHLAGGATPGLVYLLAHQYSQSSLAWHHLKNGDRTRVEALRRVAEALGCASFLALADVIEACPLLGEEVEDDAEEEVHEGPAPSGGLLRGDWARLAFLPPLGATSEGISLEPATTGEALYRGDGASREVTWLHWIDTEGQTVPVPDATADDACIVASAEAEGWRSYSAEVEPWRGNEGGVATVWYHLSALVIVPAGSDWAPAPAGTPSPSPAGARRRVVKR